MAYSCDICKQLFENLQGLLQHTIDDHGSSSASTSAPKRGPFKCEFCPKKYNHRPSLDLHRRREHATKLQYKHTCKSCGQKFETAKGLDIHHFMMHIKDQPNARSIAQDGSNRLGEPPALKTPRIDPALIKDKSSSPTATKSEPGSNATSIESPSSPKTKSPPPARKACVICQKQFCSAEELQQHWEIEHVHKMPLTTNSGPTDVAGLLRNMSGAHQMPMGMSLSGMSGMVTAQEHNHLRFMFERLKLENAELGQQNMFLKTRNSVLMNSLAEETSKVNIVSEENARLKSQFEMLTSISQDRLEIEDLDE